MKNILKKLLGEVKYCRLFHTAYGTPENKWHCDKCDLVYDKKLSDDDLGPF